MAGIILFVGFSQMAPLIQPIDTKIYNLRRDLKFFLMDIIEIIFLHLSMKIRSENDFLWYFSGDSFLICLKNVFYLIL